MWTMVLRLNCAGRNTSIMTLSRTYELKLAAVVFITSRACLAQLGVESEVETLLVNHFQTRAAVLKAKDP